MKVLMYTKDDCPYCVKAKKILDGIDCHLEIKDVGRDISKEDMLKSVKRLSGVDVMTVPQIIIDGVYIGGYESLISHLGTDDDEVDFGDFIL